MFILAISFQRCCVLVGHGRHKTSYHVLGQVGAIAEIIIINIFVTYIIVFIFYLHSLLFPFTLMTTGMVFMRQIENSAPKTMSRMGTLSKHYLLSFNKL